MGESLVLWACMCSAHQNVVATGAAVAIDAQGWDNAVVVSQTLHMLEKPVLRRSHNAWAQSCCNLHVTMLPT